MSQWTVGGRARLPLSLKFVLLILAVMLLAGGAQYLIIRAIRYRNMVDHLEQEVSLLLSSMDWAIAPLLDTGDLGSIQRLLENIGLSNRLRDIRLYGPNGAIIAAGDPAQVGKRIPEENVGEVFSTQALSVVSKAAQGLTIREYSVAIPICGRKRSGGRLNDIAAVLFVRSNLEAAAGEIAAFTNTLVYQILAATALIMLAISAFIYLWVLRPLRVFVAATRRIHSGDYGQKVVIAQRDEFGGFAEAFNIMLGEIECKNHSLAERAGVLEAEVMETTEKLYQAQKMEAVGRLAGGVAHDFNNVLTAICGYSDLLLTRNPPDQPNHEFARQIRKAADRAAALTNQLLAFSRKQVLQLRILDLNELISDLKKMLIRLVGEDVELKTVAEEGLWPVKADPSKIDQVLVNLVVNARDAMPKGGKILVETRNVQLGDEYVKRHPGIAVPGDFVMVAVSDTGTGMDKATAAHLFEPFFTTKELGKGTGLGLSTAFGIVKQSGGYIWVYSEPGEGTCFKIYLPRAGEEKAPPREAGAPPPPVSADHGDRKATILLAEDDAAVSSLVSMVLSEAGYQVLAAADGKEALRLAQDGENRIDLVITDIVMPAMNGRELVEKLLHVRPGIKVIFTSGYTNNAAELREALEPGMVFLEKPVALDTLRKTVCELLADRARAQGAPG